MTDLETDPFIRLTCIKRPLQCKIVDPIIITKEGYKIAFYKNKQVNQLIKIIRSNHYWEGKNS